ncbi:MAG: hypothetical protein RIR00_1711, partial [Pseudomonadota bacterium]
TLHHLQEAGLAQFDPANGSLDAHPLVREYFAAQLKTQQPAAWQAGHKRLYQHLKTTTPEFPDTLDGLQPLYQAVTHGCQAGLYQDACVEVYRDRILRGDKAFSVKKLGAFGADLGAVAAFFVEPWRRLHPGLSDDDQAWLLHEAAFRLRALGRLTEALEPIRTGAETFIQQKNWGNAATSYSNLSELQLTLGRRQDASSSAELAVGYADQSKDAFQRTICRTTLADAQHQTGHRGAALALFQAAETLQVEDQPEYPLLYSLQGIQYCDCLLAPLERQVWQRVLQGLQLQKQTGLQISHGASADVEIASKPAPMRSHEAGTHVDLQAIAQRASQTLQWAEINRAYLLDIALDHLTLARCALYADLLQDRAPGEEANTHAQAAVSGLRKAGTLDHLPRGLLTRAQLYHALGQDDEARADLDEVEHIASRGGMKLHLADLTLTRARLFTDPTQLPLARKLIEECGYWRRREELADAEQILTSHP